MRPNKRFCSACGKPVAVPAQTAAEPKTPARAPLRAENRCPSCGAVLNPGRKFCSSCGARVSLK
jgi:uncharacterized OB-fold protein